MIIKSGKYEVGSMKCKKIRLLICLILFSFLCSTAWAAEKEEIKKITGFFKSVKEGTIYIIDEKTQKTSSFKLSRNVKVTYKGQTEIINNIIIHSIVELTISNGIVTDIIIKEVSS